MAIVKMIDATKGEEYQGGNWVRGKDVIKTASGAKRSAKAFFNGDNDDGQDYEVVVFHSIVDGRFSWSFRRAA